MTCTRPRWTERDLFLLEDLIVAGWSDAAIARKLGCTVNALNLARKRHGIRSRTQLLMPARQVARLMGVRCSKTVTRWITSGWLDGRRGQPRGGNRQWEVTETALWAFMEDPEHWHRWEPERITDPHLREWAVDLRRGVRFLTPGQVAWRLCVTHAAVNDWIHRGLLTAVKYGNWWIRETDLAGFTPPGQRSKAGMVRRTWFPDDDRRLCELRAAGHVWREIGLALARPHRACASRYYRLMAQMREDVAA